MNLLRQPYPQNETAGYSWRLAAIFGCFVGAFLSLFQPFDINTWQTEHKLLKVWGFGGITFGIMVLMGVLLPRLAPRFFAEERWTVGKQIAHILAQILLITLANRLYLLWLVSGAYSAGWIWSFVVTCLVGIFPTTGAVVANYIRQLKRYKEQAALLSATLPPHPVNDVPPPVTPPATASSVQPLTDLKPLITLLAENGKDAFTVAPANLLAIESSDNYCTIFYVQNHALAKELIRSSLSRLENQLPVKQSVVAHSRLDLIDTLPGPFVRCHRSYVVNLDRVDRVLGNAQGYKLHLLNGQLMVPVARKYNDTLIAGIGQL
jgi:DNA-binding LytR/AlgR family response regulator